MIHKISLIGLGAMGCFFAPKLYDAYGDNFRVIADGKRAVRLKEQGVYINDRHYVFPIMSSEEKDVADLVIIAVKNTTLDQAIADIRNQVGENTLILAIQNGVDSEDKVAAAYGWDKVMYSFMRVSIVMKNYCASYDGSVGNIHFGEKNHNDVVKTPRVLEVEEVFKKSNIKYVIDNDMIHAEWFKFISNVGENITCAILGVPFGAFRTSEHANYIRIKAMQEVIEIAAQKEIIITEDEIEAQGKVVKNLRPENKPSTLQDIENERKTEIETFSGAVVRMGRELGIATPVNELLYHAVKALEEKYI